MAKNIVIYGTGNAGATIIVKYKIAGSADPYTIVNIPVADLPYTIIALPDEDYEVVYSQHCINDEVSEEQTIPQIDVCICDSPVITQGQVANDYFQIFYNFTIGSTYILYVDEVPFVINNPTGSYIVTGLQPNRTYTVYIVKHLPNAVKCTSNTIDITTTDNVNCLPITGFSADLTSTTALLLWTASAGAISYDVYIDGSLVGNTTFTNYLATGLTPGGTYIFSIVPVCVNGYGVVTNLSQTLPVNIECLPPTNLQTVSITDTTIQLTFTPWDVTKQTSVYLNNVLITTLSPGTSSYLFTGLSADTVYNISLITVCSTENYSIASNVKTVKTTLIHPPILFNAPTLGSKEITISWNTDPLAITYTLYKNGVEITSMGNGSPILYYTFEGLTPNTMYNFSIRANYPDAGPFASQASTTLPVVCLAATNLITTLIGNNRLIISWDMGSQTITSQQIYVNGVFYANVAIDQNTKEITGLTLGTSYIIYIITNCTNGGLSQSANLVVSTSSVVPLSSLTFTVDHTIYVAPNYQPKLNFTTHPDVSTYRIKTSEFYIEYNAYSDTGDLLNLNTTLEAIMPQNTPKFLEYRPMMVVITSKLYNGDEMNDLYWYVFDLTNVPNGYLLSVLEDLPTITVTDILSTKVDLLIDNLISVIGLSNHYKLTAFLLKSDDLDTFNGNIQQSNATVIDVNTITVIGLTSGRQYYVIVKWENTTASTKGYCIPIGITTI